MPNLRLSAAVLALVALAASACGGDDDKGSSGGASPPAKVSGSSPTLSSPVSRFALSLDDLPQGYLTDRQATFVLDPRNYGSTPIFESAPKGEQLLKDWGYIGGYETGFEPEQRMTAVLNGSYFAAVEVHLFKDSAGAEKAKAYFEGKLQGSSERVSSGPVGNESSAWKLTREKIPGSNIDAVYHRVIFRRGNLIAVVQTYGSNVLMKVETAISLATMVDAKALGDRPAVEPTPLGQPGANPTTSP